MFCVETNPPNLHRKEYMGISEKINQSYLKKPFINKSETLLTKRVE